MGYRSAVALLCGVLTGSTAFADEAVGGAELGSVHGFAAAVTESLTRMLRDGVPSALEAHLAGALV